MVDLESYVPMIDAILSVANPDQATPKKIRKALQELFSVDLDNHRKDINKIIVDRFQESQKHPKRLVSYEELQKQDEATAKRLTNGSKKRTKSSAGSKKRKTREGSGNSGGFNRTKVMLAEPLSEFLGETESTRTQVVKSVWDYIKRNNLQNPEDKREILCDEKMKPIFGDKVTMFSMNKTLSKFIRNSSDVTPSKTESQEKESSPREHDNNQNQAPQEEQGENELEDQNKVERHLGEQ
ncbi:TRI1 (YMR233W) and UAF30 (YOR295W) [Zygosaccharomyces parabailii]|nr:TRI1 (YMR233W) and UAF30 (YOR295W) [Zygosaccharomyces parabailii]CDH10034.1 related to Protein TRI1 [Zygosaccharomyces bailii ISA1307]